MPNKWRLSYLGHPDINSKIDIFQQLKHKITDIKDIYQTFSSVPMAVLQNMHPHDSVLFINRYFCEACFLKHNSSVSYILKITLQRNEGNLSFVNPKIHIFAVIQIRLLALIVLYLTLSILLWEIEWFLKTHT